MPSEIMQTIRAALYKPKVSPVVVLVMPQVDDWSPLAKFWYADEKLMAISNELDSFDGRREPQRCTALVNKLRHSQDTLLHIIGE